MKKLLCLLLLAVAIPASADVMPLNGSWVVLDEVMTAPAFFSDSSTTPGVWSWTSTNSVVFDITDLYVISDDFNLYVNGALYATLIAPDWNAIGCSGPMAAGCYTADPGVAFASGLYAS